MRGNDAVQVATSGRRKLVSYNHDPYQLVTELDSQPTSKININANTN